MGQGAYFPSLVGSIIEKYLHATDPEEIFCLRVYNPSLFGATRWALYVGEAVIGPEEVQFILQ